MNKFMGVSKFFTLVLFIGAAFAVQCSEPTPYHVKVVERLIAAFNAQDTKVLAKLVTDDIKWLSIANEQVIVETSGKGDLIESMNAYFKSCPTCRSELTNVSSTSARVSAVEIASWQGKDGFKSQMALSVYEFSDGLISRVYYFPAEK